MERCLTILPPPPSWLTTVRAALGARWFRSASAMRCALRRTQRAPVRAAIVMNERVTPMLSLHACDALAAPSSADRITSEDDRWLRPTETLPPNV